MLDITKNYIKYMLARFRKRKFILSRCACLGRDILSEFDQVVFDNFQKHRIDHHLTLKKPRHIKSFFNQIQIYDIVKKQAVTIFSLKSKPDYIVIDTYSELVDKRFSFKDSNFFCVASDLKKNVRLTLNEGSLIPVIDVEQQYLNYFKKLKIKFNCPIIVILFPSYLDNRQKYQDRFQSLKSALENIDKETDLITLLQLNQAEYIGVDHYPYHFSEETKARLRAKLQEVICVKA